jgi:hypothetical protein
VFRAGNRRARRRHDGDGEEQEIAYRERGSTHGGPGNRLFGNRSIVAGPRFSQSRSLCNELPTSGLAGVT